MIKDTDVIQVGDVHTVRYAGRAAPLTGHLHVVTNP